MIPFTLRFPVAEVDGSSPTGLDAAGRHLGGDTVIGLGAFRSLASLREAGGGVLSASASLTPRQGCYPLAKRSYDGVTLEMKTKFDVDTAFAFNPMRSHFAPNAKQQQVYDGVFRLSWTRNDSSAFWGGSSTPASTQIVGQMLLTYDAGVADATISGVFLGVMDAPPEDASPRVMITFETLAPIVPTDPHVYALSSVELHGNWNQDGNALERFPGYATTDFATPTSTQVFPGPDFTHEREAGTEHLLHGHSTGGLGFSGINGSVGGARISSVLLELLNPNGSVAGTSRAPNQELSRAIGGPLEPARYVGASFSATTFPVGAADEEVWVNWFVDKALIPQTCDYRVTFSLEGVESILL